MYFADGITITTLVENYVDMLIPNTERIKRPGLAFHFDPRNKPIQAENGLSMLVDISFAGQNYRILFDAGLSNLISRRNYNYAMPGSWISKALRISRCALVTSVRI